MTPALLSFHTNSLAWFSPTEPTKPTGQAVSLTQAMVAKATQGLIMSAYLASGRDNPYSSLNHPSYIMPEAARLRDWKLRYH